MTLPLSPDGSFPCLSLPVRVTFTAASPWSSEGEPMSLAHLFRSRPPGFRLARTLSLMGCQQQPGTDPGTPGPPVRSVSF